jgi:hypothetical protein
MRKKCRLMSSSLKATSIRHLMRYYCKLHVVNCVQVVYTLCAMSPRVPIECNECSAYLIKYMCTPLVMNGQAHAVASTCKVDNSTLALHRMVTGQVQAGRWRMTALDQCR